MISIRMASTRMTSTRIASFKRNRFFRFWLSLLIAALSLGVLSSGTYAADIKPQVKNSRYSDWYQVNAHNSFNHYGDMSELLDKVNSIEYDVHPSSNWAVYHNDDDYGSTKCHHSLNVCLKGVRKYHDDHPDHAPITIFIEIKNTSGFRVADFNGIFCGPKRKSSAGGRSTDDAVFECSELFRPSDLIGKATSLREAVKNPGWKTVEALKGKIIFVVNGVPQALGKYMNETKISKGVYADNKDRTEASAFVMIDNVSNVNSLKNLCNKAERYNSGTRRFECDDKNEYYDVMQEKNADNMTHINNVVFFNATCSTWLNDLQMGSYIRSNNLISRAYTCDHQDAPNDAVQKLVKPTQLNFVAYDGIENAFEQGNFTDLNQR